MSSGYTLGIADQQRVVDGAHDNHCRGKVAHPSKRHARAVLTKMHRRGEVQGQLDIYHCASCGRWHLGHRRAQRRHPALVWVPDATPLEVRLAIALRPYLEPRAAHA